jgi:hypothetical protein
VINYVQYLSDIQLGLKRKPIISFSRKAKISENSLAFLEISRNFVSRKYLLSRKILRKTFCLRMIFAKNIVFAKDFAKKLIFAKIFAKIFVFAKCFANDFQVTSTSVSDLDKHSISSWIRIRIPNRNFRENVKPQFKSN